MNDLINPLQTAADNIIGMLWNLMEAGLEELKLLQTAIILITTNSVVQHDSCLLYTSPSPRDLSTSRMPSSA